MGVIICPIHGRQFFWEMCEHLWEEFENNNLPVMEELSGYATKICIDCYKRNNVENFQKLTSHEYLKLPDEEYLKLEKILGPIYDNLDRRCKCIECIKFVQLNDARKDNKKLPFEPFDNTLMHKDNIEIEELREILIDYFKIRKLKESDLDTSDFFHIKSGGISYPFSIKIFNVIESDKQKEIIKLIDSFFEGISQQQRKISFFEAEYSLYEMGGKKLRLKQDEILIFEKIIK